MTSCQLLAERERLEGMLHYEKCAYQCGFFHVAGVDEAGRGPLAGPVVAAACILPRGRLIEGVNDSKQLKPSKRYEVFQRILEAPGVTYGIGVVDAGLIDEMNILQATFQAMLAAISQLFIPPDYLLVDGNQFPPTLIPGKPIIKGDLLSLSIAAASIIAKEKRDQIMRSYDEKFPQYGFSRHKGYGTPQHLRAIQEHGPSEIHRKSFLSKLVKEVGQCLKA